MVGASKLAALAASQVAFRSGVGVVKLLVKEKINHLNWFLPTGHPQDFQIAKLSELVHRQ